MRAPLDPGAAAGQLPRLGAAGPRGAGLGAAGQAAGGEGRCRGPGGVVNLWFG